MSTAHTTGRMAVITGASSGIGEATARALAADGHRVALLARRADRIQALASELGDGAIAIEADVTDRDSIVAAAERVQQELGGADVLVNNAGVMLLGPVEAADTEHWRRMIEVNCLGLLYCTHAALPLMREGGGGHIVNVSSVAGRRAALGAAVYNMTKFGVTGFSEALRQETLHMGVRVTIVEPGYVETELQAHNAGNPVVMEAMEQMRQQIAEPLQATDIADAIVYAITRPQHVSINEVLVRPTMQRN
jgi:NADP-dependent 3-hydroxy acid dehydrogenase YdfG